MRTTNPRVKRETKTKAYDYKERHGASPQEMPLGANDVPTVNAVVAFQFHGDEITTFEVEGEPYVAMRRIVENLGMAWGRQQTKLMEQEAKFNCTLMCTVGADGKRRDMLSIPLAKLPLWLASINPNKVPDLEARAKIELYQERSAQALYEFWFKAPAAPVHADLDADSRKVIGGIVKGVIHKELIEALTIVLPKMVATEVWGTQYGVVPGKTAGDVIEMAGITDTKGLRRLPRRVSDRLRRVHAEQGVAVQQGKLGKSKAYMFDNRVCREWLLAGGKEDINRWAQEMRGQHVLRLVVPKKWREQ